MDSRFNSHACHKLRYSKPLTVISCQVGLSNGSGAGCGSVSSAGTGMYRSVTTGTSTNSITGLDEQPCNVIASTVNSASVTSRGKPQSLNLVLQFILDHLALFARKLG